MKQPLGHIYFLVIIEKIIQKVSGRDGDSIIRDLIQLAQNIQQMFTSATDSEELLLHIEYQAVVQVLLKQLAEQLNCEVPDKLPSTLKEIERYSV